MVVFGDAASKMGLQLASKTTNPFLVFVVERAIHDCLATAR